MPGDWRSTFGDRLVSADAAVREVQDGDLNPVSPWDRCPPRRRPRWRAGARRCAACACYRGRPATPIPGRAGIPDTPSTWQPRHRFHLRLHPGGHGYPAHRLRRDRLQRRLQSRGGRAPRRVDAGRVHGARLGTRRRRLRQLWLQPLAFQELAAGCPAGDRGGSGRARHRPAPPRRRPRPCVAVRSVGRADGAARTRRRAGAQSGTHRGAHRGHRRLRLDAGARRRHDPGRRPVPCRRAWAVT